MSGLERYDEHRRHPYPVQTEMFEILVKSPRVDLNIQDDAGDNCNSHSGVLHHYIVETMLKLYFLHCTLYITHYHCALSSSHLESQGCNSLYY